MDTFAPELLGGGVAPTGRAAAGASGVHSTMAASAATATAFTVSRKAPRDPAIDYLRAFVILVVLAGHCALAYATILRQPTAWNSIIPILDLGTSSAGLSYIANFLDIASMGTLFFLSALFVAPALMRHGPAMFLRGRMLRLALPFLISITLLLPLGYYAAWELRNPGGSYANFWSMLARGRFYAAGPAWFLWVLLAFDCLLAAAFVLLGNRLPKWARTVEQLGERPVRMAGALILVCTVLYLPMFARSGFAYYGGWRYLTPPFLFEPSHFLLYWTWSCLGFLAGAAELDKGLLAPSGSFLTHWRWWAGAGAVVFNLQWLLHGLPALAGARTAGPHLLLGFIWVVTHVMCVLGLLALFRGAVQVRRPVFDSLARCSYGVYLLHYVFMLWCQRLLLPWPMGAWSKFTISFTFTLGCSWSVAALLTRTPGLRRIL